MNPIDNLIATALEAIYRTGATRTDVIEALEALAYQAKAQGIAEVGNEIQGLLTRELMKCVEEAI
jgi:hypothetical protein